jgi:hypothetical protein
LSSWVRFCCDSRVDAREPLPVGEVGLVPVVVRRDWKRFTNPPLTLETHPESSSFRPDFGSRLKEK